MLVGFRVARHAGEPTPAHHDHDHDRAGGAERRAVRPPESTPARYRSVIVFAFENRSWDDLGPGFGPGMPYLHGLGSQCSWFAQWTETDEHDKSLAQYVGQVTGARQPGTVADCKPSAACSTTADNLFRQLRTDRRDAVNFVEGGPSRAAPTATPPSTSPRSTCGAPTTARTARSGSGRSPIWIRTGCPRSRS